MELFQKQTPEQYRIASVSMGKDSLCMLLLLLEYGIALDEVLFYDSGMDYECIRRIAAQVRELLTERRIRFSWLKPKHPAVYEMLECPVHKRDGSTQHGRMWCGGMCRWGTANKREAIKKRYREIRKEYPGCEIVEFVGIAADEQRRLERKNDYGAWKCYPLVELGMTEADCLRYCWEHGWHWDEHGVDLYEAGFSRISCFCCTNKRVGELYLTYRDFPEYWNQLLAFQERIPMPFKAGKTVMEWEELFRKNPGKYEKYLPEGCRH